MIKLHNNYTMSKSYKQRYSFQERKARVRSFEESDPDKIMMIIQKHPRSNLPDLLNSKFLTFKTFKFGQVKTLIENRIKQRLSHDQGKHSYYIFIRGTMPSIEQSMSTIYDKKKDKDGVLYITYQQQQSF